MRRRTTRISAFLVATMLLFSGCVAEGSDTTQTTTQTTTTVATTAVTTTAATTVPTTLEPAATTTATVTKTMVTTTKTTTKATTTAAPTTTAPTRPPYALHKDHLSGWEVTVDGKQVTVSVIEDETGWTYVSLVPLLDSLENVDRIVWENRAQAMIYRTPVSDSGFCAGKKFSLDIQRGELYQLIPLRDNWNILQIRVAGTTSHNVNGYIVRGNELFVDTHVLQMVGMSFDFKHEFLWEEQRLEITTPR